MSTKEWKAEALPVHGFKIIDDDGLEIVRDVYRRDHTEQIVNEHNAVMFALRSGENWTPEDWQNWLRYHAQRPTWPSDMRAGTTTEKERRQ